MSIVASGRDRTALPNGLLTLAKSHMRVDGIYDDAYIAATIARAISWFERGTNVSVNPVMWTWAPAAAEFVCGVASVPVSPVNSFIVKDAAGVDVSDDYTITTHSQHGIGLYSFTGAHAAGMTIAMPSGYANADDLDPGIADAVLRYAAHLYEHREILVPGSDAQTPGWTQDVIATYWMPRA